jgi:CelD/BcsL family acetyltransferase involved in cellulose biosynthesis
MADWKTILRRGGDACLAALDFAADEVVASPFQHPAWLAAWARTFPDPDGERVFLVETREAASDRVVMRLPLALEDWGGVRVLRGWDRGTADYGGLILARDFAPTPAVFAGVWRSVLTVLPPCDVLVLDKLPDRVGAGADPLLRVGTIERSFNSGHVLRLGEPGRPRAVETFDGSMRRSLARKRRKLANKGALAFRLRPAREAGDVLEALLGWRRDRFAAENADRDVGAVEAFWRRLAAEADIAHIADLSLDGRPLAAGFGTRTGESFQLLATGFDPAWKNWSPGLLLLEDLVDAAETDGVRIFDFTIGDEAYKLDFAVESVPLYDLFTPRTVKGRLAAWVRRVQVRHRRRRVATVTPPGHDAAQRE